MRCITVLLAFMLATTQAYTRPLTPPEHASLDTVVQQLSADIKQNDIEGIIDAMPVRIVDHFSELAKISTEQFRSLLSKQLNETMTAVTILSINIDLTDLDATNADNMKTLFVKIPYSMRLSHKGKEIEATSALVAIYEGGKWGLLRLDPTKTAQLIDLYPLLKDVDF